jgi:hypothetical protein
LDAGDRDCLWDGNHDSIRRQRCDVVSCREAPKTKQIGSWGGWNLARAVDAYFLRLPRLCRTFPDC